MASDFPTTYDGLTNPTGPSLLTSPSHANQHTNANDILEAIEQRVGLSGTAFPGSPTSGQFFYRTDRRLEYFYDGTRWLTKQLFLSSSTPEDAGLPWAVTSKNIRHLITVAGGGSVAWLEAAHTEFYVVGGTALSASHSWVGSVAFALSIDSGASDVWRQSEVGLNVLWTPTTTYQQDWTKTGTPGNLYIYQTILYRIVG